MKGLRAEIVLALRQLWSSPSMAVTVVRLLVLGVALNVVALKMVERVRTELPIGDHLKEVSCAARMEARTIRTVVLFAIKKISGSPNNVGPSHQSIPNRDTRVERCSAEIYCRRGNDSTAAVLRD